ncbi:MAG: RNA ligase family protein [Bradyrhizobiaceae bacterium]|nr:RNA ligase family protein [Bradyrhizobiaceae bacterium]
MQPGDEDRSAVPFSAIAGRHLVVEEKVDGANAAISFAPNGALQLQSRGHFLTGGPRERHFGLLKRWAHGLTDHFWCTLGARYVLYGEWLYAKHTIFYDALPHYFLEFDVLDLDTGRFLDTAARRELLSKLPIVSVPVLHEGTLRTLTSLSDMITRSVFKSPRWRQTLDKCAEEQPHDLDTVRNQTDWSDLMEGLYIKVEEAGVVVDRLKFVRHDFLTTVVNSKSHWQTRPILPNLLAPGVTLFDGPS